MMCFIVRAGVWLLSPSWLCGSIFQAYFKLH